MSNSVTPWTIAQQAPLSMGFPRQEYWSGLPFLSPGTLPHPRIEPGSPYCRRILDQPSHQKLQSMGSQKKVGQDLVTKQRHIVRQGGVLPTADLKVKESAGNLHPSVSSVMSDSLWPHGLQHTRLPLPIHHQLLELAQTHVHQVSDAIQSSHPLSSPSPPAFNLSQHQGLFKWVGYPHQVAKVLELQHQSFQWIFRTDFL